MPSVWGLGAAPSKPSPPPSVSPPRMSRDPRRPGPKNRSELAFCSFRSAGWDPAPWARQGRLRCDRTFMPVTSHLAACRACRGRVWTAGAISHRGPSTNAGTPRRWAITLFRHLRGSEVVVSVSRAYAASCAENAATASLVFLRAGPGGAPRNRNPGTRWTDSNYSGSFYI